MFVWNPRVAIAASLTCGILATGLATWAQPARLMAGMPAPLIPTPTGAEGATDILIAPEDEHPETKKDRDRIQGIWDVREVFVGGRKSERSKGLDLVTFEGGKMI